MGSKRDRLPRLARFAAAIVLLGALAAGQPWTPNEAVAQSSIGLYRSEQFGWFFFYDAATWSVEEQSSAPGVDYVRLSDGDAVVAYRTMAAPTTTAESCLETVLATLAADPSIVGLDNLTEEGGPATVLYADDDFAVAQLVVTVDGPAGRFKFAALERCERIDDAETLLHESITVPATSYNAGRTLESPSLVSSLDRDDLAESGLPIPIVDETGATRGTLSAFLRCVDRVFYVVAENAAGGSDFVVDPSAFLAVSGETVEAVAAGDAYPTVPGGEALVIRPGDVGLLQLSVERSPFALYYAPAAWGPTYLGGGGPCYPARAAPVLIDME